MGYTGVVDQVMWGQSAAARPGLRARTRGHLFSAATKHLSAFTELQKITRENQVKSEKKPNVLKQQ